MFAIAAIAALVGGAGAANAVTIVNGSFEQLSFAIPARPTNSSYREILAPDSTSIVGWTVGVVGTPGLAGVDVIRSYWQPSDGLISLDLSARDAGSVSQLLTDLRVGFYYTITFDLSSNPSGSASKSLLLTVDGETPETYTFSTPHTRSEMEWTQQSYTFIASAQSALLTFSSLTRGTAGPAIDNVSIGQTIATQVPEPESWMMMVLGFGMVGFASRRRKRAVAA